MYVLRCVNLDKKDLFLVAVRPLTVKYIKDGVGENVF